MIDDGLASPAPRCDEQRGLNALLDRRRELAGRLRDAEYAQRFASEEYLGAQDAVRAVEHRRARGDDVPESEAKKAMAALRAAEATRDEPWALRADGARGALRDLDNEVGRYVVESFDALLAEREADARAAAERVDRACAELIAAHAEREGVAGRVNALVSVIRRVDPGEVPWSRADGARRAAAELLDRGGEVPPIPRVDPRVPPGEERLPEIDPMVAPGAFQ